MKNGFEINITESDFKAKPQTEQNWILFQGILCLNKEGCQWGKNKYRKNYLGLASAIGGGAAFGLGAFYTLYKILMG